MFYSILSQNKTTPNLSAQVGGLMAPEFVASAFLQLVQEGPTGAVMAVWNKVMALLYLSIYNG